MATYSDEELDLNNPPFPLTAIDRELLAMRDEDFKFITWDALRGFIENNRLEELKRCPSDLRRYLKWSHETKTTYGSITNFVVQERLKWAPNHEVSAESPLGPTSFSHKNKTPFQDLDDYKILLNDWPYGLATGITHIVVWSRTPIAVDSVRGDVTPLSRHIIEQFVYHTFIRRVAEAENISEDDAAKQRVLWFKNWVSLQSVRGVDHVHVLVKDVSPSLLRQWTNHQIMSDNTRTTP